jgi:hypothetical protein
MNTTARFGRFVRKVAGTSVPAVALKELRSQSHSVPPPQAAPSARRGFLLGLAGAFLAAAAAECREVDLLANPFDRTSAHHRPIGTGAVYGLLQNGVRTRGRLAVITEVSLAPATGIKYMNTVRAADPMTTVRQNDSHGPGRETGLPCDLRIPADAAIPPYQPGHDNCVLFFPRNGEAGSDLADQFFGFHRDPAGIYSASVHKAYSLRGTDVGGGTSASRIKFPSGVMRGRELVNKLPIRHALQVAVTRKGNPAYHLLSKEWRWPALGTDGGAQSPDVNLGDLPYGTRVAIRPQDAGQRETLGLSEVGKLLFDAHLYYGVLIVDGTGAGATGAKWNYRRDQDIPNEWKKDVEDQLRKIVPLLWPIANTVEHEEFAGGGKSLGGINTAWDAQP